MKNRALLLLACALLLTASAGLLLFLNHAKFQATFENRTRDRQAILARDIAQTLEAHLALGLTLSDTPALRDMLGRALAVDNTTRAVAVLDLRRQTLVTVGHGSAPLWQAASDQTRIRLMGQARAPEGAAIALPLHNAYDMVEATLVLEYDLADAWENSRQAFGNLWPLGLAATGMGLLILLVSAHWLLGASQTDVAVRNRRMTWLLTGLLFGLQSVFAWNAYQSFRTIAAGDAPVLASTLAETALPTVQRALALGIPMAELKGAEEWLASVLNSGPEFSRLTLQNAQGTVLYSAQVTNVMPSSVLTHSHEIRTTEGLMGTLVVELNVDALTERTRQLAIEFVMVLLAGGLLIHEVLRALSVESAGPEKSLAQLRLPLFLFFFGSELPRSFLPVWSKELAQMSGPQGLGALVPWLTPLTSLKPEVLASLPLSVFLLAVAISSPFAGRYCARHGSRRLFALGVVMAVAGHLVAFVTDSLGLLIVARVLAGISFGAVSMAAFDHIAQQSTGRAAGMALYLSAYVAAGISGAGLGALVADRMGFGQVFAMGILACGLAWLTRAPAPHAVRGQVSILPFWQSVGTLLKQPAMARLILLVALPLQIVQQGLLFYWAPLALASMGEKTSFVGLAMMGYFVAVLMLNMPVAKYADQSGKHHRLVVLGLAISGAVALVGGASFHPLVVAMGIVMIGVAWALAFPSQGAVAFELSQRNGDQLNPSVSIGVYRSIERVGAMLAPILVASLVVSFGYATSALILGGLLVTCALAHGILSGRKFA